MWDDDVIAALRTWLGPTTWDEVHPADMGRFYDFILAYWRRNRDFWDETLARETMLREWRALWPNDDVEFFSAVLNERRQRGSAILSFLERHQHQQVGSIDLGSGPSIAN
jgi:hypothetical protein